MKDYMLQYYPTLRRLAAFALLISFAVLITVQSIVYISERKEAAEQQRVMYTMMQDGKDITVQKKYVSYLKGSATRSYSQLRSTVIYVTVGTVSLVILLIIETCAVTSGVKVRGERDN